MRALLNGWDHAAVNSLLRMPVSGLGATLAGDRFDFGLRETLPGRGLPIAGIKHAPATLDVFQRMSGWRRERLEPAEWAERLRALGKLVARPAVSDTTDRGRVDAWRSAADACARFGEVVEEVGGFAEPGAVALDVFWKQV